jgi:hypothetical protein
MSETRKFRLVHDIARQRAVDAVRTADEGDEVLIRKARKTRDQEEKYHAMFGDIARQVPVRGERRTADDMKRLLFSAFKIDTQDDTDLRDSWAEFGNVRMEPGLRGEIVVFGEQTRKLPKKLASALIEWLYAFGAEHDVQWSEPKERRAA